jgi:hypothetical protein
VQRFQFRLSTLLSIILAVACFLGGAKWNDIRLREEIRKAEAAASTAIREKNDLIFSNHRDGPVMD